MPIAGVYPQLRKFQALVSVSNAALHKFSGVAVNTQTEVVRKLRNSLRHVHPKMTEDNRRAFWDEIKSCSALLEGDQFNGYKEDRG